MRSRVGGVERVAGVVVLVACAWGQAPSSSTGAAVTSKAPTPTSAILRGVLEPALDQPVADVTVIASPIGGDAQLFPIAARVQTKPTGEFDFRGLDEGKYSISVLVRGADAKTSATLLAREWASSAPASPVHLVPATVDIPLAGNVLRADGAPAAGAFVHAERREDGAMLHALTDASGAFAMALPRGTWRAFAETGSERSDWQDRVGPSGMKLALVAQAIDLHAPAPKEVVDELKSKLALSKDGAIDVAAFAGELGKARIVALGDSLRGTHEEHALTADLFRALVEKDGVQLLALDAPFGEMWNLDLYVTQGKGDPRALLAELSYGDFATAEMLELVAWMRAWNADEKHARKLHVCGVDVLHTRASALLLQDFYPKADPVAGGRFSGWMSAFKLVGADGLPTYGRYDDEQRVSLRLMFQDLVGVFPDEHDNYLRYVTQDEYDVAHQHVRALGACEEVLRLGNEGWTTRDRERHMLERLQWSLARCGEDAKAMIVARNAIVGVEGEVEFGSFGWWLRHTFADELRTVGVCVGSGRARLVAELGADSEKEAPKRAETIELPAPRAGTIEDALARTGVAAGVVDLRALAEKSPARAWLGVERIRRSLDGPWLGELGALRRANELQEHDLVAWIASVTPARALPAK